MVEVTLNLGSIEKGSISDSGSEVTASSAVRTANYVTGNEALYECEVECGIVVKDDIEGSFSGDSSWRNPIPDCPTTFQTVKTDNPNDTCEYYHFVRTCIEPPSQTYPQGRTRQWAGYMINLYPTIGFNHEGNVPRFMYRGDNEFQSSNAFLGYKSYVSIDMSGEGLITYYKSGTSGETVTKTIFELLFGEKSPDNDDTLSINLAGSRGSKEVSADIALIGYNANNQVVYNKRWVTAGVDRPYIENIINYLPISKWKFVFKNEEYYSDIKTEYILKPSVKLRVDSWEMAQDNILVNSGMCEEISGDILTYPFPKSFWELDTSNELEMFMLPEPPAEGSFMDCTTLEYVSIPESVQYIGKYAFTHTSLTRVRISRTCTYYPTSFPPGCEIWFYGDEMEPADDFYSKAEIDAMMIRLGILGLELFKISDLETRKISILEGD